MKSIIQELESLLFDWESGTLDEVGIKRIRELLRSSEEARTFYLEQQTLSAALKLGINTKLELPPNDEPEEPLVLPTERIKKPASHFLKMSYWAVAGFGLLFCLMTGRLLQLELFDAQQPSSLIKKSFTQQEISREPTSEGIALLSRVVDVEWAESQNSIEVGDALLPGRFAIQSGYAQIEFFCGATVIVEGPADLFLHSPLLAKVRQGKLRAQVPPAARGFSLEVDDLKVVDLGTEFGISVTPDGTNVQVFDGEVELQQAQVEKKLVQTGTALVRDSKGKYSASSLTPDQFLDIASLDVLSAGRKDDLFKRWRVWSEKIRHDDRLIAYYAFEQKGDWHRRLNSSREPQNRELDGAIVGANRASGRWKGKEALDFKRPGDRVRIQIPGEFNSLTFACWVKIDSLDRWYNSLFLTDQYNQGEPHWQILDTGQLFFSVRYKPDVSTGTQADKKKTHQPVLSPPFWEPSMSGRWLHLATTYNASTGQVTHYLNGEKLHQEVVSKNLLVKTTRIGAASIGNWSIPTRPDSEFAIRNLNGSMDEFMIFADELSSSEIKEIYNNGKP